LIVTYALPDNSEYLECLADNVRLMTRSIAASVVVGAPY
jgi:hypothetical protein